MALLLSTDGKPKTTVAEEGCFFFALSPEVTGHSSPEPKVIGHELAINHSSLLLQREATYYVKKKSRF